MKPLRGFRVLSVALNLPGPAALARMRAMGASCVKLEPPGGDPMARYCPALYAAMHKGVRVITADLKTEKGVQKRDQLLSQSDLLLSSFRPSALVKLGLDFKTLRRRYPISCLELVGSAATPEAAGHDLTYLAEQGLLDEGRLPQSLFADMSGALLVSERALGIARLAKPVHARIALSDAAAWLAVPKAYGLTGFGALLGGANAGYAVYAARNGQVALAALEAGFQHRFAALCGLQSLAEPMAKAHLRAWFARHSVAQLEQLAAAHDLPLHAVQSNPSAGAAHGALPGL